MTKKRPTGNLSKADYRKLQLRWYKKLRKSGFRDIEGTSDFNDFPVSTLRSSGGTTHLPWDFSVDDELGENRLHGWDGQSGLGEHGNWEYYQRIHDFAESIKGETPTRKVLLRFLDKHPRVAKYQVPGVTPAQAMKIWNRTIKKLGLPPERPSRPMPERKKKAPARHLTSDEIARLNYSPPNVKR